MTKRALLISILIHVGIGLLLGTGYWWHVSTDPSLTAPLGSVFVQEASIGKQKPAPTPAEQAPVASAETEEQADEDADAQEEKLGGTGALGLPNGDAVPLGSIAPEYPPVSRKLGEEGTAVLLLGIAEDGSVTSAVIESSSGHSRLDEAARKALLDARFQPGIQDGAPVPSMKRFSIEFRLEKAKKL